MRKTNGLFYFVCNSCLARSDSLSQSCCSTPIKKPEMKPQTPQSDISLIPIGNLDYKQTSNTLIAQSCRVETIKRHRYSKNKT